MNTKVDEGKLISGKEALIALANGESVEMADSEVGMDWTVISKHGFLDEQKISAPCLPMFFEESENIKFRLKPRTITLNGIEVPAPFEPKEEDQYWYLDSNDPQGYNTDIRNHEEMFSQFKKTAFCQIGLWRTEEEIKQVVSALRQVFGGSHDN